MTNPVERPTKPEEIAHIAHRLPRRLRVRVPHIASRPEVCQRIADVLAQSADFDGKISVNLITGSIVIESPNKDIDTDALVTHLRQNVETELRQFPTNDKGSPKIAQSIARAFSALNADMRTGLHRHADLAALLPLILGSFAVLQIVTTRRLPAPAWFNFCWWSFRAFMTFHKDAAKESAEEPLS